MTDTSFNPQMPDIQIETREMDEAGFLELAMAHMDRHAMACFLDSAGAIGPRSQKSLLTNHIAGLFLQVKDTWEYRDLQTGHVKKLDKTSFRNWLNQFHGSNGPYGGSMLFPMLTYEAFNPFAHPDSAHPLWQEPEGVWLLASSVFIFDRKLGLLTYGSPLNDEGPQKWQTPAPPNLTMGWRETEKDYYAKIALVQRDIYDGVYYQANLSQRFLTSSPQHPLATYRRLRGLNPSPFMGIFRLGDLWVLSGSPERLAAKFQQTITARPIAGTKPRSPNDPEQDNLARRDLLKSPKEQAEHLMLVDLIRNDLGRVASPGSVFVDEFCTIESYSHVHHLVSQVNAELKQGADLLDFIPAVFPGGTITGAPKISCIKRLSELEEEARGPYTGSMGYIDTSSNMDLNILIRTLIQNRDKVCFHGGGGIVADSQSSSEYQETRQKCMALMEALNIKC